MQMGKPRNCPISEKFTQMRGCDTDRRQVRPRALPRVPNPISEIALKGVSESSFLGTSGDMKLLVILRKDERPAGVGT